jgi:hypothetical protein
LENGYGSPKIRELHQKINAALDYDHSHDLDGTIDEAMPFLEGNRVRFRENILKIPQAESMNDQDGLVRYQNAWINMIEDTENIAYVHTPEHLKKLCRTSIDQGVMELAVSYGYGTAICRNNPNLTEENIRFLVDRHEDSLENLVNNNELVLSRESQKYLFEHILDEQKSANREYSSNLMSLNALVKRSDFALRDVITEA